MYPHLDDSASNVGFARGKYSNVPKRVCSEDTGIIER